jgi:hypothetical protein
MAYRVLVTVILGVHFAYLGYVVLGGFLAWRWTHAIWPHLLAGAWGLAVVGVPLECPLTAAESWVRRKAGQPPLTQGFIARYIEGVLYPARYTVVLQIAVGVIVVVSWIGAYRLWRRRRRFAADTGSNSEVSSRPSATV